MCKMSPNTFCNECLEVIIITPVVPFPSSSFSKYTTCIFLKYWQCKTFHQRSLSWSDFLPLFFTLHNFFLFFSASGISIFFVYTVSHGKHNINTVTKRSLPLLVLQFIVLSYLVHLRKASDYGIKHTILVLCLLQKCVYTHSVLN